MRWFIGYQRWAHDLERKMNREDQSSPRAPIRMGVGLAQGSILQVSGSLFAPTAASSFLHQNTVVRRNQIESRFECLEPRS